MSDSADLLAYLERLRGNCVAVLGNDAAGPEAMAQADDWFSLLDLAIEQIGEMDGDGAQLLNHWHRLLTRITDELRAGLHRGEAAAAQAGVTL